MKKTFIKIFGLFLGASISLSVVQANPTGGNVTSGSATISTVPGTVTINQASNTAVINWNSFSINHGELTQFLQPNSQSAVLNRVLGGETSTINGTLSANGQVYLINGNGIIVGSGGVVNASGFTASTRDISDSDFMSGNLHFTGSGDAGVQNLGKITALGGDVVLIGKTVDNRGKITAANGTAGLIAGDDVLLGQSNSDGSTILVHPSVNATDAAKKTGVHNSGTIASASAELKAANGNIYALAINNTGTVRATAVQNKGGHIWLVADKGTVVSSGTLQTSDNGFIETSGEKLGIRGKVSAGQGGEWLIDPTDLVIGKTGNLSSPTVSATVLSNALNGGTSELVQTQDGNTDDGNITVSSPITWNSTADLSLQADNNITIKAAITGAGGELDLHADGNITDTAALKVDTFDLITGNWMQTTKPAAFFANNFELTGGTFLRVSGGTGAMNTPYLITDVFGLQGITGFNNSNFTLANNIDATGTTNWNDGEGFKSIQNYQATFNGAGHIINGLTIVNPQTAAAGLFDHIDGTVENLGLTNVHIDVTNDLSVFLAGGIAGVNGGTIRQCYVTGSVAGNLYETTVGGVAGENDGTMINSYNLARVSDANDGGGTGSIVGGLVGNNSSSGVITNSYSAGLVSTPNDGTTVGGLIGSNAGTVNTSYWSKTKSGQGNSAGGTRLDDDNTDSILRSSSFDPSWKFNDKVKGDTEIWDNIDGASLPFLHWQFPAGARVITGGSQVPNQSITILVGKTLTSYSLQTFADDFYQLLLPVSAVPSGTPVVVVSNDPDHPSNALGQFSTFPFLSNMSLSDNHVVIASGQPLSLKAVTAPLLTYNGGNLLFTPGATSLVLDSNVDMVVSSPLTFDLNVTGLASHLRFLDGAEVSGTGSFTGAEIDMAGGRVNSFGPVAVASFIQTDGQWDQSSSTLAAFSANDFELNGGEFMRVKGGSGTPLKPFLISDVYGLQGITTMQNNSFTLANNIDAHTTASWNSGMGFVPISNYTGVLNGAGHAINGLTIQDQGSIAVGLFSFLNGTVENLGMVNANINSNSADVGAITGANFGTISQCYATGSVSLTSNLFIGGLVGLNIGTISNSYSLVSVTNENSDVANAVGGLVGREEGTITNSYSAGHVTAASGHVGGLVGNSGGGGPYTNNFWDITTSGQSTDDSNATGLTNSQMQIQALYTNWDFKKVWSIKPGVNGGLPELVSQLNK